MLYAVITRPTEDLFQAGQFYRLSEVDRKEDKRFSAAEVRITSYNVCYTKLLRDTG